MRSEDSSLDTGNGPLRIIFFASKPVQKCGTWILTYVLSISCKQSFSGSALGLFYIKLNLL